MTEPGRNSSVPYLSGRRRENLHPGCPAEFLELEDRFNQVHVRLFPLLGRKVRTPEGPGTLLQVFAGRVTVLLDAELNKASFFSPTEIRPVSPEIDS